MSSNAKKPHLQLETPENTEESSSSIASEESVENEASPRERGNRNANSSEVRRAVNGSASDSDSDDDEEEEDDDLGANQLSPAEREIQVDFEARSPQECDFHGIVNLLRQMMRSSAGSNASSVNVSDLADHIIAQRNVGSVITQSHDDMDDDDDSDEEQENHAGGANNANGRQAARSNEMLEPNNEVSLISVEFHVCSLGSPTFDFKLKYCSHFCCIFIHF
jgi:protein BCP1